MSDTATVDIATKAKASANVFAEIIDYVDDIESHFRRVQAELVGKPDEEIVERVNHEIDATIAWLVDAKATIETVAQVRHNVANQ